MFPFFPIKTYFILVHRDSSVQMSVKSIHSSIYRISNGIIENLALLEFFLRLEYANATTAAII